MPEQTKFKIRLTHRTSDGQSIKHLSLEENREQGGEEDGCWADKIDMHHCRGSTCVQRLAVRKTEKRKRTREVCL